MHEWSHAVRDAARAAAATCEGLLATGDDQSTRKYEAEQCNGPRSTNTAAGRRRRWVRQDISIGVKKQIVRLRDANITWLFIFRQLPVPGTQRNAQKTVEDAAFYRAIPNDARTLSSNNRRGAKWPKLDALFYERYLAVFTRGLRICQLSDHSDILNTNASGIRSDFCRHFLNADRICIHRPEEKDMNKNTNSIQNKSDS